MNRLNAFLNNLKLGVLHRKAPMLLQPDNTPIRNRLQLQQTLTRIINDIPPHNLNRPIKPLIDLRNQQNRNMPRPRNLIQNTHLCGQLLMLMITILPPLQPIQHRNRINHNQPNPLRSELTQLRNHLNLILKRCRLKKNNIIQHALKLRQDLLHPIKTKPALRINKNHLPRLRHMQRRKNPKIRLPTARRTVHRRNRVLLKPAL